MWVALVFGAGFLLGDAAGVFAVMLMQERMKRREEKNSG